MRIADRFTSRRSDNLRSAIVIRPKALGLITKSRIDGDLATPVLRQRGPSAYVHCAKERLEIILPPFFLLSYRLSASFLSLPLRPLLIFPTLSTPSLAGSSLSEGWDTTSAWPSGWGTLHS